MHTYECETCGVTVEIERWEVSFGNHEHVESNQCPDCFHKTLNKNKE